LYGISNTDFTPELSIAYFSASGADHELFSQNFLLKMIVYSHHSGYRGQGLQWCYIVYTVTSATAPYRYFLYHVAYGAIVSYAPAKTSTFGSNRQIILVAV